MSKGSHDCRTHCRGCGHYIDLVAGECPVCELVHYIDKTSNVEPQVVGWDKILEDLKRQDDSMERFQELYLCTFSTEKF